MIRESTLGRLLLSCCPPEACLRLLRTVYVSPDISAQTGSRVSRAVIAQALNLLLFHELLLQVRSGRQYVDDRHAQGHQVVFDHGAVRTVALPGMGALPAGERAITRVLIPLGYDLGSVYPLDRLGMTGRSYTHQDFPEALPQFFVSELHPERFSPSFQTTVARVTASSREPLPAGARLTLADLERHKALDFEDARKLLPELVACFARQHAPPSLSDYEALLLESREMAWIATEGNAFNHATDRVPSLDELVTEQRRLVRPLKDKIEISRTERVRQTAFRADLVEREFVAADGTATRRSVPGSFFEFIQRDRIRDANTGGSRLDLAFDTGNAQGIFKMTAA